MNHVSIIQYTFAASVFPIMPDHNLICIHAYITFVQSYAHHCTLVQDKIMLAIYFLFLTLVPGGMNRCH